METIGRPERREFRMDPALLWSVIESQAGSAEKALLEAIMNAVDAGATRCDITLSETGYSVQDDGGGFKSREDIEQFFETFGTPHKDGDGAVYGTYRMGRGQLFAFSKTRWETGCFIMEVDIKGCGLEYTLHTEAPHKPGCAVAGTWYEPIPSADVIKIDFELRKLAAWIQIPVHVNNKLINKSPATEEWTYETDDAYIRLKPSGGLAVYNLGALVKVFAERDFGTGGIIVSKRQLKVNFARNDILTSKCTVWKRIRVTLDSDIGNLVQNRRQLSTYEMQALADRFAKGQIPFSDIRKINLLTDVSGKSRSLNELIGASKLCIVPDQKDWTVGERVMNQQLAFVLRSTSITQFGADTAQEFMDLLRTRLQPTQAERDWFQRCKAQHEAIKAQLTALEAQHVGASVPIWDAAHPQYGELRSLERQVWQAYEKEERAAIPFERSRLFDHIQVVSLEEVSSHITDQYDYVDPKKLPPHQKALLQGLQSVAQSLHEQDCRDRYARMSPEEKQERYGRESRLIELSAAREEQERDARKVLVGDSDVALGWTDGKTFIAVDQSVLRDVLAGDYSISYLVSLMVHEHCHDEPDQGGHIHSMEFYQRFHDIMMIPYLAEMLRYRLVSAYAKAITLLDKKPNQVFMSEIRRNNTKLNLSLAGMEEIATTGVTQA